MGSTAASIFLRRGIQYRASTAILCKAGPDLGNLMHGFHDFQLSDDVLHKVHIGHYTFYSKAIVKNPKMMIRAPGVFAREYIKGEDRGVVNLTDLDQRLKLRGSPGFGTALNLKGDANYADVMHIAELATNYQDAAGVPIRGDVDGPDDLKGGSLYTMGNVFTSGANQSNYFIRGTCYLKTATGKKEVVKKTINSLGFGESTYPGARYAREGRGVCLAGVDRTLKSMI